MEGSDLDQRDLIPLGSRLRSYIFGYQALGVRSLGMEDLEDDRLMEQIGEYKRYHQLYVLSAGATFSSIGLSYINKGFAANQRIGRRIRVVGLEMSYQVQCLARTSGSQDEVPGTGNYVTATSANGPAYFRIVLLVAAINDPNWVNYPNVWDHSGYPCSQFADDVYSTGYKCIFDKKHVLPADGGKILDHVYIDCDFIMEFADETAIEATMNTIECRYFLDEAGGISLPNGRMQFSTYWEDD